MFQIIAPIKVDKKNVVVAVESRDQTPVKISNYGYKLDTDAQVGLVKPGTKPYIGIQAKLDDFSIGIVSGTIVQVVPSEKGVRLRVKSSYGPYVTVFERENERFVDGAEFLFVGFLSVGTYNKKEQYTLFSRASECLKEAPETSTDF